MRTAGLAALLLLATLAPARAQDACLEGASTLADQRALATVRANTESACPCDGGVTKKIWQRCAKNTLLAAQASSTIRRECVRVAKATNKGATCGSSQVACGRVATRDDQASCKLTRADRCTDTAKVDATACTGADFCADVVTWSAGTCEDVRVRGPFESGFRLMPWEKDSVVSPGTPRPLPTAIWYPTAPGSGPLAPDSKGVVDAPLDPSGGPYPVILFSHGSCGYPLQSTFLTPILASRGYIVVAPPHPGNTLSEFPNCGTPAAQIASFQERPQDMIFVLNQILAANADPGSPFFGAVDTTRIAMTGHSFGGLTTFLVQAIEPRIDLTVAMAAAAQPSQQFTVPSLVILGENDSRVSNPNNRSAWGNSVAPKYLVEVLEAGHYVFSDLCFPGPDCAPPATLTQDESHALALRYIVPFIERHLGGDERFASFFTLPAPAGVLFEQAQL
jgi:predicted dienelactone hydrolase